MAKGIVKENGKGKGVRVPSFVGVRSSLQSVKKRGLR